MAIQIDGIEYVDGNEAAQLLGVKKPTLYAYVSRGIVRSYRQQVGRHRLYRRDDIEQLCGVTPERTIREQTAPYSADSAVQLPNVADWAGDH